MDSEENNNEKRTTFQQSGYAANLGLADVIFCHVRTACTDRRDYDPLKY